MKIKIWRREKRIFFPFQKLWWSIGSSFWFSMSVLKTFNDILKLSSVSHLMLPSWTCSEVGCRVGTCCSMSPVTSLRSRVVLPALSRPRNSSLPDLLRSPRYSSTPWIQSQMNVRLEPFIFDVRWNISVLFILLFFVALIDTVFYFSSIFYQVRSILTVLLYSETIYI